jgi:membrane peptidoglycan carboxypeptidase
MPWDDMADSVRRSVEAVDVPTDRSAILGGIVRYSILAGLIVAAMIIPGAAYAGLTVRSLSNALTELPTQLDDGPTAQTTRMLSSDGKQLAFFYQENRQDVPLTKINRNMQKAILAIEDNRFYKHGALDLKGTMRAVVNNASSGTTQGGSSITQQLVKLMLVQRARSQEEIEAATAPSIARKVRELALATQYEKTHSKDEILERYLNIAYYGDGAYGINAAAHHWFSTSPDKLTVKQSALLAGVVKNPSYYDPKRQPDQATQRRNTVLAVMAAQGKISSAEAQDLSAEPLGLKLTKISSGCAAAKAQAEFACDYARRFLLQEPALGQTVADRAAVLERGGLTIESTIDPKMQKAIGEAVTSTVAPTDEAIGAQALIEPGTGKVRGVAQSRPMGRDTAAGESYLDFAVPPAYGDSNGFQGGSTFKLFTTAAALKEGIRVNKTYNARSRMTMPASAYRACNGGRMDRSWPVKNSTTSGRMNMYKGLRQSVNTYFAQLEKDAGLCNTVRMAREMGVNVPVTDEVGPFTLGATDVSPLTMAAAYAVPASGGMYCKPQPVARILDMKGNLIKEYTKECTRVLDTDVAAQINDILAGLQKPGGFGYSNGTALKIPSAAKTGTTQDNKAVWYVGYTPKLVAASMIAGADDEGRPQSLSGTTLKGRTISFAQVGGSSLAGPMWKKAMGVIQNDLAPVKFGSPPEREPGKHDKGDDERDDDSYDPYDPYDEPTDEPTYDDRNTYNPYDNYDDNF